MGPCDVCNLEGPPTRVVCGKERGSREGKGRIEVGEGKRGRENVKRNGRNVGRGKVKVRGWANKGRESVFSNELGIKYRM